MVQLVKNLLAMRETWVRPLGREDPLEKGIAVLETRILETTPVLLPREFHGQRSLEATVHGVAELDMTERLSLMDA